MATGREIMKAWVVEALEAHGGKARILDICKYVWKAHENDIKQTDNLLFEWQYEIRWAGSLLRKEGVIRPADSSSRGTWELA